MVKCTCSEKQPSDSPQTHALMILTILSDLTDT